MMQDFLVYFAVGGMSIKSKNKKQAWVVAVNMGYGHQRAAAPFTDIALGGIITANDYPGIPATDRALWKQSRRFYEIISRASHLPIIGPWLFNWYDRAFQEIEPFYPKRNLSKSTFQLRQIYRFIRRQGWGKHLIDKLNQRGNKTPLLTSFFVIAFFAEEHNYQGDIYCLATDTDISRVWVPLNPKRSRIKYLAPTVRVQERLKLYGVPPANIFLTGFPLPKENIGGLQLTALKQDLWHRIHHLDPQHMFVNKYRESLRRYLGPDKQHCGGKCNLSITFSVGGAGAQREIGITIATSFKKLLQSNQLTLNLIAGTRADVADYFKQQLHRLKLADHLGKNITILYHTNKDGYFNQFNNLLHTTDVLWTKPSELAFFTGLGIPIIIAPPIGSQEYSNQRWLESIGGGIYQLNPAYAHQWLLDWRDSGWLAEAALEGFLDAPKFGTYAIERLLFGQRASHEDQVELI